MPRSGGQVPALKNDFTPTSLNAAMSAGLLMGNSQSSMRVSPEIGMVITKKATEVSKSFKVVQSNNGLVQGKVG